MFYDFVNLDKTTGESIANAILAENSIDVMFAREQAYDDASGMSSEASGVQGRIRRIAPMALYTHCNSHVLSLNVAAACRLTSVRNMIGTLNETFLFFHFSPNRHRLLEHVLEKCGSTSRKEKLKGLHKTRLVKRHECYETFYELYEYVCISLEAIVDHESHPHVYSLLSFTWDRETKTKAKRLMANLKTFGFIFTFLITKNSLGTLKTIAAKVQKKHQDVFKAYSMIDHTMKVVARVRSNTEEGCHECFEDASKLADKIGATVLVPRITGRQEHRNNTQEMSSRFSKDNRAGGEIVFLGSFCRGEA